MLYGWLDGVRSLIRRQTARRPQRRRWRSALGLLETCEIRAFLTAPIANGDTYEITSASFLVYSGSGLLSNDSDPDYGDTLSASWESNPTHGSIYINYDGSFSYYPDTTFTGTDSFTYRVTDNTGSYSIGTVALWATPPTAVNDPYYTVQAGQALTDSAGVLGNDTGYPTPTQAQLVTSPTHGSLTLNTYGSFTYTPHTGYAGPDSFTYKAHNGVLASSPATVSINVTNTPPTAVNDFYTMTSSWLAVSPNGVLANDADPDPGPSPQARLLSGPTHAGYFAFNTDGSFTYTPGAGFAGSDSFTYEAWDGVAASAPATVSISYPPVDVTITPPGAINENSSYTLSASASGTVDHWIVNWGDGTAAETFYEGGTWLSKSHLYPDDNPTATPSDQYTIQVTAVRGSQQFSAMPATLTVNNVKPTFTYQPTANGLMIVNRPVTLSGATFDDVAGSLDSFTAWVDWGDGGNWIPVSHNNWQIPSLTHDYQQAGNYLIQLKVLDDDGGEAASNQIPVNIRPLPVISGFTLEQNVPDQGWQVVPAEDAAWTYYSQRWTPDFAGSSIDVQAVIWEFQPWSTPEAPWVLFATGTAAGAGYGDLAWGDWAVRPRTQLVDSTIVDTNIRKRVVIAKIDSITWDEFTPESGGGDLVPITTTHGYEYEGDYRFFPDASAPGQAMRSKVRAIVQVLPVKAGVRIQYSLLDVDDPTDDHGVVDNDAVSSDANLADNYGEAPTVQPMSVPPVQVNGTDISGRLKLLVDLGDQPRAGDNYRLAVAPHQPVLNRLKPKAASLTSGVFNDVNLNDEWDLMNGEQNVSPNEVAIDGGLISSMLTVWRRLHLEVDRMGAVAGNSVAVNVGNVVASGANWKLDQLNVALDEMRFEEGTFKDANGVSFDVISNTENEVVVSPNGMPAMGAGVIKDDDSLQNGAAVPLPDLTTVARAMADAFVEVDLVPSEANTTPVVPFVLNISTPANLLAASRFDTAGDNSESFWCAYLLGGYQGPESRDWDGSDTSALFGSAISANTVAVAFDETITDFAGSGGWNGLGLARDVVVHELGHAVGHLGHDEANVVTTWGHLIANGTTFVPGPDFLGATDPIPQGWYSRYTKPYLKAIRQQDVP